jgi:tetratricopeptide (TPR) repeat protein
MSRDPIPPFVRSTYALDYLLLVGRREEALREAQRALQEDPVNFLRRVVRAACLVAAGRDEEAYEETLRMLELNPEAPAAHLWMAIIHLLRVELEKALESAERAYALAPSSPVRIGLVAGLLQRTGDAQRANGILQKVPESAPGSASARALFYWACSDLDAEANWLEKATSQRDPSLGVLLPFIGRELRGTPHWARLRRKLNLPEG